MVKPLATFGISALALLASAPMPDAKTIRYEIEGRSYSYSTNNREQAATARQRIKAAEAAASAKAKAEAELASNPLVRVFGSQTQTEAKDAQAKLQQVLAATPSASADAAPAEPTRRAAARTRAPAPAREARAARAEPRRRPSAAASTASVGEDRAPAVRSPRKAASSSPATTGSTGPAAKAAPAPEAIVFDVASGIKTTHLPDGTVQEDLFEPGEIAALKTAAQKSNTRVKVVNEGARPAD